MAQRSPITDNPLPLPLLKWYPFTAARAEELGFTVDRTKYPWVAYKGPWGNPTETMQILTDIEARCVIALQNIRDQDVVSNKTFEAFTLYAQELAALTLVDFQRP